MLAVCDQTNGVSRRQRWLTCLAYLMALITCAPISATRAENVAEAAETQIKAAMLFKFLDYTEWPATAFAEPQSPYRIWLLDANEVGNELRAITRDRYINGRAISVFKTRFVERIDNPHIVFVGRDAEHHLPHLAQLAEQQAFLIVTENSQGLVSGSTINLRLLEDRIGFDVSLSGARRNNLKLSARLLSVASTVEQETLP